jgi:hypothetical protein
MALRVRALVVRCTLLLMLALAAAPVAAQRVFLVDLSDDEVTLALRASIASALDFTGRMPAPKSIALPDAWMPIVRRMRSDGDPVAAGRLDEAYREAVIATLPHVRSAANSLAARFTPRDPKALVAGGDDATTQYFRGASEDALARAVQPTVRDAIGHSRLAEAFRAVVSASAAIGLATPAWRPADLERAVTDSALREVFRELSVRERALRRDPSSQPDPVRRVFAAARGP